MPKRVTSGGVHLRAQHLGNTATKKLRRAVGDAVSDLTGPGIEPGPPAPIVTSLTTTLTGLL